jgi:CMP-N-acetylneuraminic acid synthetase
LAALLGAETYTRPNVLAGGKVLLISVIKEMIRKNDEDDIVGIMLPTNPLRILSDILGAFELFKLHKYQHSVVSVSQYEYPAQLALIVGVNKRLRPMFKKFYVKSSRPADYQNTAYKCNDAIIFNNVRNLRRQSNLIGRFPLPYIMPMERSISIDYSHQLECVKWLKGGV